MTGDGADARSHSIDHVISREIARLLATSSSFQGETPECRDKARKRFVVHRYDRLVQRSGPGHSKTGAELGKRVLTRIISSAFPRTR
jgi:hypothetical protein